ncbi:MAG: sigma factor-like helix-turn-helix DNA-binding protein [Thermoleophilaceae bacterium]
MAAIDDLPPDQRAVLQLLLKQGQSYDGIAALLGMDAGSVRARAHAALESLGPESGRRMSSERRAELADYLLGQLDEDAAKATHDHLAASARGRAWARVAAGELRPLAGDAGLPAIPEDGAGRSAAETPVPAKPPPPKRPVKRPSARPAVDPEPAAAAADESERPAKRTAKRTARTEEAKVDRPTKRPAKKTAKRTAAEAGAAKLDEPAKGTAEASEAKVERPAKRPAKKTARQRAEAARPR